MKCDMCDREFQCDDDILSRVMVNGYIYSKNLKEDEKNIEIIKNYNELLDITKQHIVKVKKLLSNE